MEDGEEEKPIVKLGDMMMQARGVSRVPRVWWLVCVTIALVICGIGLRWWTARGMIREIRGLGGSCAPAQSSWGGQFEALLAVDATIDQIRFQEVDVPDEFFDRIGNFHHLSVIWLIRCKVSDAALSRLRNVPTLREIILDDTNATDATVETLAELPQLTGLRLDGTKITDTAVPGLAKLSNLNYLGLSRTAVGDAELLSLKRLPNLRSLDLSHTNVTDAGLEHLHSSTLYIVNVQGTKATAEGVARLQRSLGSRVIGP